MPITKGEVEVEEAREGCVCCTTKKQLWRLDERRYAATFWIPAFAGIQSGQPSANVSKARHQLSGISSQPPSPGPISDFPEPKTNFVNQANLQAYFQQLNAHLL